MMRMTKEECLFDVSSSILPAIARGRAVRGNYSLVLPSETISSSTTASRSPLSSSEKTDTMTKEALDMAAGAHEPCNENNEGAVAATMMNQGRCKACTAASLAIKKPRLEGRSSSSSSKVRKEKLGDRISVLQQLVAPFGKSDTASVLMEAIGYIKFLQDQVETLSVPYLRSSSTSDKASRGVEEEEEDGIDDGETKEVGLRSKGLCLVPLSCTSYICSTESIGGIWPPVFN